MLPSFLFHIANRTGKSFTVLILLAAANVVYGQVLNTPNTLYSIAGGAAGNADGTGPAAQFNNPSGITVDTAGNLYVADFYNSTIRKITSAGVVSTLAGTVNGFGSADGTGPTAQFYKPIGITVDTAGNLYVADFYNSMIRKITSAGVVSTLAGTAGMDGSADGTGPAARFANPISLVFDKTTGNLYVADYNNATIRKITATGVVSTLAGSPGVLGSADGTGPAAQFDHPIGITVDTVGNLYVADEINRTIRKITSQGVVSTLAGTPGVSGSTDGTGAAAKFYTLRSITADTAGNLYVADSLNQAVRKITSTGVVSTVVGYIGSANTTVLGSLPGQISQPQAVIVMATNKLAITTDKNEVLGANLAAGFQYNFAGLMQPIDNPPVINTLKAGSAVPVKFSLAGDQGLNILAQGSPSVQAVSCNTSAPIDAIEETVTAGGSVLTYDASSDQYTYVWKTDKAWTGTCRQLTVKLTDDSEHTAIFQFVR
jgi:hypothetical protein